MSAPLALASGCAHHGTVVLTVATSPPYLSSAAELATSARRVGFPCTVVALPASLHAQTAGGDPIEAGRSAISSGALVAFEPSNGASRWLPEPQWCRPNITDRSGYRQTHILKTQALVDLLSTGVDVFLVDADWRFVADPLSELRATEADVAAMRDTQLLNFGLAWIRSGSRTVELARRVANRTFAAWDQAVLSEEAAAAPISCCFSNPFIKASLTKSEGLHRLRRDDPDAQQLLQPGCAPAAAMPPPRALPPPDGASGTRLFLTWRPDRYNSLPMERRRYSRCSTRACPHRHCTVARPCSATNASGDEARAPPARLSPRSPPAAGRDGKAAAGAPLSCTVWPRGSDSTMSDRQRCRQGNLLRDGFLYYHNAGRGTASAVCGPAARCTCCRRRAAREPAAEPAAPRVPVVPHPRPPPIGRPGFFSG